MKKILIPIVFVVNFAFYCWAMFNLFCGPQRWQRPRVPKNYNTFVDYNLYDIQTFSGTNFVCYSNTFTIYTNYGIGIRP